MISILVSCSFSPFYKKLKKLSVILSLWVIYDKYCFNCFIEHSHFYGVIFVSKKTQSVGVKTYDGRTNVHDAPLKMEITQKNSRPFPHRLSNDIHKGCHLQHIFTLTVFPSMITVIWSMHRTFVQTLNTLSTPSPFFPQRSPLSHHKSHICPFISPYSLMPLIPLSLSISLLTVQIVFPDGSQITVAAVLKSPAIYLQSDPRQDKPIGEWILNHYYEPKKKAYLHTFNPYSWMV